MIRRALGIALILTALLVVAVSLIAALIDLTGPTGPRPPVIPPTAEAFVVSG